jgi:hypothetical protein
MVNFTGLTPSASTSCVGLEASTAEVDCGRMGPHSHICVQCGGQFVIGLSQPGSASVDYVYMQPGTWGRVPGTQALKSAGDILTTMGEPNSPPITHPPGGNGSTVQYGIHSVLNSVLNRSSPLSF